ncbi:MAG TPA: type II secretion system protein [Anaerovoracaceae bacterium]|nr:type II secretion system protein [Anaerovoracaceae bacterium]
MKNNKGFSLIELIVVIAIMAVLVGVIAPQFLGYTERTKESILKYNTRGVMEIVSLHTMEYSRENWYVENIGKPEGSLNNFIEDKLEVINNGDSEYTYGNNSNIVNPYSSSLAILDWNQTISSGEGHCPAVFLTEESKYSHDNIEDASDINNLIGTIVVYFNESDEETDEIQFYYIKEDGSKSEYLETL